MTDEVEVTESGGTVRRISAAPSAALPDLEVLEALRREQTGLAAPSSYFSPGTVVGWHYGIGTFPLTVVRDDERGLVAWLPEGSTGTFATPRDGRGLRDRTLAERAQLALAGDWDLTSTAWRGRGVLRIAPAGRPWSLWYFHDDDGFAEYYVNLELPHRRPIDGSPHTYSRDLTLDLCIESDGSVWLKDEDELAAWTDVGIFTAEQAAEIHAAADQVRREVFEPRAWPLDEDWEGWRPPPLWDQPLTLPDPPPEVR